MDIKLGKIKMAAFTLICVVGIHSISNAKDKQNEAEVAAFYAAGLPDYLIEELDNIQAKRNQVNAEIEGRLQEWNSYALKFRKARATCANTGLNDTEKADCKNLRQSLQDEGSRFHQLVMQDKHNLANVKKRYEDFKIRANLWLDEHMIESWKLKSSISDAPKPVDY